jgi:flagellar hook protein FlgE
VEVENPGGLEKGGGTLFRPTTASGISTTGFTLAKNTANGSSEKIYTNSLEQSNVDMAAEFVKMILTQRAYSANSKTITTSDEMTQEVINLKR